MNYNHFTIDERIVIAQLMKSGCSIREISRILDRVMEGKLDPVIEALINEDIKQKLSGKEFVSYMNSLPIDITWNSQGDTCKKWTYSEIFQLKTEMMNYVKPIVEYQRYLEKLITNYQTQEEIISLNIEFTREKIDECIDILWGKPTEEQPPTEGQPDEEQPPTEGQPDEEQPPAEE